MFGESQGKFYQDHQMSFYVQLRLQRAFPGAGSCKAQFLMGAYHGNLDQALVGGDVISLLGYAEPLSKKFDAAIVLLPVIWL